MKGRAGSVSEQFQRLPGAAPQGGPLSHLVSITSLQDGVCGGCHVADLCMASLPLVSHRKGPSSAEALGLSTATATVTTDDSSSSLGQGASVLCPLGQL